MKFTTRWFLIGSIFLLTGCTNPVSSLTTQWGNKIPKASTFPEKELKLETFHVKVKQPDASAPPQCTVDQGDDASICNCGWWKVECEAGQCKSVVNGPLVGTKIGYFFPTHPYDCNSVDYVYDFQTGGRRRHDPQYWCAHPEKYLTEDGYACIMKPVVYLYPEIPTLVNVEVKTDGDIFVSDPLYPVGGWQNVLVQPSGLLTYQGKQYRELFYESTASNDYPKPSAGITIDQDKIRPMLHLLVEQLGLVNDERDEFVDFWTPRLEALNAPYILFSVVGPEAKNQIDQLLISPEPDTRIEFLAYFKALDKPFAGEALQLPTKPERKGFTMVEWGGTIDQH